SPHVSVVTNYSPNHLDWHDTLEHYRWAKQTMLRRQTPIDLAVLNADDPDVLNWPARGRRLLFGLSDHGSEGAFLRGHVAIWRAEGFEREFPLCDWLKLPGRHNLANALAAATAALGMGATIEHVRLGLEQYEPLPHRLQFVGEVDGRKFFNDSLATTPESAIVGIDAFDAPVVLLSGGYDKQVDLTAMALHIAAKTKAVALMGQTAAKLRTLISGASPLTTVVSEPLPDFRTSFQWAWDHSAPGDVILLSPGCASYDWFRNFADRGAQFSLCVRARMRGN
ncbi:MAG: Mur ligase family protein, partial [Planctomycetales bacterium]